MAVALLKVRLPAAADMQRAVLPEQWQSVACQAIAYALAL
jgi:hypothetical protein